LLLIDSDAFVTFGAAGLVAEVGEALGFGLSELRRLDPLPHMLERGRLARKYPPAIRDKVKSWCSVVAPILEAPGPGMRAYGPCIDSVTATPKCSSRRQHRGFLILLRSLLLQRPAHSSWKLGARLVERRRSLSSRTEEIHAAGRSPMPKRRKHRGRNWLHAHREAPNSVRRGILYAVITLVVLYGLVWVLGDGWRRLLGA